MDIFAIASRHTEYIQWDGIGAGKIVESCALLLSARGSDPDIST